MQTTSTPAKSPFYVSLEVSPPQGETGGVGHLWASLVSDSQVVFTTEFHESLESVDTAIEQLLTWANNRLNHEPRQVEFVVWNKDDFARLMHGLKWLSLDSLCFISYYACITCMSMQEARHALKPLNLPTAKVARAQQMAKMFQEMLQISQMTKRMVDTIVAVSSGFPSKPE